MKPVTRPTARSRPRNLDVSSQLELFASLPISVKEEPIQIEPPAPPPPPIVLPDQDLADVPVPPPEVVHTNDESESTPFDNSFPDDATDFDPATLEALTPMPENHLNKNAADDLADLFDSDPFFNPEIDPATTERSGPDPLPSSAPDMSPESPPPTAEERLLDTIVGEPTEAREPITPDTTVPAAVEPDRAQSRVTSLERELGIVRDQLLRETQLRQAESVRFATSEREWKRKSLTAGRTALNMGENLAGGPTPRYPAPVIAMAIVALIFSTGLAFFVGRASTPPREDPPADAAPADGPPAVAAETAPIPAPVLTPVPRETQPTPTPWPALKGAGFKATRDGDALLVRFNYGVFARGTEMTGAACQDLRRIANTLTSSSAPYNIEVEGHTDAAPVSSGRPYSGNHELGLARAKVAAEYLSKQCGLPADRLTVTSAGEANPPYPNTTPESRRLNRTVVLKLTPTSASRSP
ncbi:MAG: OmpA family protein [bacterium]